MENLAWYKREDTPRYSWWEYGEKDGERVSPVLAVIRRRKPTAPWQWLAYPYFIGGPSQMLKGKAATWDMARVAVERELSIYITADR